MSRADAGFDAAIEAGDDVVVEASEDASGADADGSEGPTIASVVILQTAEERGWLQPQVSAAGNKVVGGAANVAAWWRQVEHYTPQTHLVLSSGGSWIGAPSSTWLKGRNVVEAMNLMGYRAATLGPRDYDFGRSVLAQRIQQAQYSFVSANTLYADTGTIVEFVDPYVIVPVNGVQVAVIGLMDPNHDVNPAEVKDLLISPNVPALEQYAIEARAKGADVLVALSSDKWDDWKSEIDDVIAPVDVIFTSRNGGPTGRSAVYGDKVLVDSGWHWSGYHRVRIDFDRVTLHIVDKQVEWVPVQYDVQVGNPVTPDPALEASIQQWEAAAAQELDRTIGYAEATIAPKSWAMANWITDSWLWAYPHADIAIQNSGGMQQAVSPGVITVGDVLATLPFENHIYEVTMKGADVVARIAGMLDYCDTVTAFCFPAVAGIRYDASAPDLAVTLADGTPIDLGATYTVLTNSYLYWGGAGFAYDPDLEVVPTSALMRDPVLAWTETLGTSVTDPLENHLDPDPRDQ